MSRAPVDSPAAQSPGPHPSPMESGGNRAAGELDQFDVNQEETAMTPETEGDDEKGPDGLPYVNDPQKKPQPSDTEADADDPDIAGDDLSGDPQ